MRTARRYLAREIYRSCAVVLLALLGLFTFFAMVDDLDNVGEKFTMMALLYMQALALPTRLYDLLPIGLLIGAILALAGLAQRNELVILRVSGVSGMRLLRMLWIVTIPLMIGAALLSEYVTPWAEMKSGEANLALRGKAGGDRLNSGYWFKEPTANGGTRIINIGDLKGDGQVANITLYEFKKNLTLSVLSTAPVGVFSHGDLVLKDVSETRLDDEAADALANARPQESAGRRGQGARAHHRHHAERRAPDRPRADARAHVHRDAARLCGLFAQQPASIWSTGRGPVAQTGVSVHAAGHDHHRRPHRPDADAPGRRGRESLHRHPAGCGLLHAEPAGVERGHVGQVAALADRLGPEHRGHDPAFGAMSYMEYRHALARFFQQRWPWSKSPA